MRPMNQPAFRPLTVGEILDQAFGLYRTYLSVLVTITVVCTMVPLLGFTWMGYLVGAVAGTLLLGVMPYPLLVPVALLGLLLLI